MSYVVLARKYRPQTFEDVYAQEHITKILVNAIENDRIAHAFLFTGPRGVGKTSLARILAKTLNCTEGSKGHPCNKCSNCVEITSGISSDVIEIDGASNTGVDDIRELQKELLYTTNSSKYKIYIIDEVHMLSKNAFNALLKTLEEPPENVIFIFATTEPHKVIPTIISRCQRYDFKRIPVESIVKNLKNICNSENLKYEEEALFQIAKKADGGMRDALSLMDQVISTGNEIIDEVTVREVFGILSFDVYENIMMNINSGNTKAVIENLHSVIATGKDIIEVVNGFLDYLRFCLLANYGVNSGEVSDSQMESLTNVTRKFDDEDILYIISILMKTKMDMKYADHPEIMIEIVLIKLSKIHDLVNIDDVIAPPTTINIQSTNANNSQVKKTVTITESNVTPQASEAKKLEEKRTVDTKKKVVKLDNTPTENIRTKPEAVNSNQKISLDVVNNNWDKLNRFVKKNYSLLATYLLRVSVEDVVNNRIIISTDSTLIENKFKTDMIILEEELSKFFDNKVTLEVLLKKKDKKVIEEVTIDNIEKKSPDLAKLIKDTNSKIVNIQNR